MKKILFVNYGAIKCGVYQYGKHIYDAIKKINQYNFMYFDCIHLEELYYTLSINTPDMIIYNYHSYTMEFVKKEIHNIKQKYNNIKHIWLMHEITHKELYALDKNTTNDYYLYGDPTYTDMQKTFSIGRLIPKYNNQYANTNKIVIGTYGFLGMNKGLELIAKKVQQEFDEATIRINLAPNDICDKDAGLAKNSIEKFRKDLKKPKIILDVSYNFYTDAELLDFLAQNTINVFFYSFNPSSKGISSGIDQAIAVERPIAITNNTLFRHLFFLNDKISIEQNSLIDIIKFGNSHIIDLKHMWDENKLIKTTIDILRKIGEQ